MTPNLARSVLALLERSGPSIGFAELDIAAAIRAALREIAEGRVVLAPATPSKPEMPGLGPDDGAVAMMLSR